MQKIFMYQSKILYKKYIKYIKIFKKTLLKISLKQIIKIIFSVTCLTVAEINMYHIIIITTSVTVWHLSDIVWQLFDSYRNKYVSK